MLFPSVPFSLWSARPWLAAGLLLAALACGEDRGTTQRSEEPLTFSDPVPLAGCEAFDYGRCDVREPECLENLAQLAACMRSDGEPLPSPNVALLSERDAEQDLLEALAASPPPSPNHFETALVILELTQPNAFQPETQAKLLARTFAAYYRRDTSEVVVIDHGIAAGVTSTPAVQALVLHELIHALQDREHDLDAFALTHQRDSDGNLRGTCLIEGEARMHELRLYSALWGVDTSTVDWPSELRRRSNEAEDNVFLDADLYSASLLNVPYGFGAEYVERIWAQQGMAGVRTLFSTPPASVREILAPLWGQEGQAPELQMAEPLAPEGLTREAFSTLGAWGIYLLARPRFSTLEESRQIALSWRGDLLEAFSFADQQTAVSWTINLATEADAARLFSALMGQPPAVQLSGTRVRLLRGTANLPQALLDAATLGR
jgi:hypothetical protein